jgi:hypothetical protein
MRVSACSIKRVCSLVSGLGTRISFLLFRLIGVRLANAGATRPNRTAGRNNVEQP